MVDFGLVGESRWIEAHRTTAEAPAGNSIDWLAVAAGIPALTPGLTPAPTPALTGAPRDGAMIAAPVIDAISATLDSLGSRDVRRLYLKAPDSARLERFQAIVAREVRARGFIPLSASVAGASPSIAALLASRSIVLFGDARCGVSSVNGSTASTGSTASAASTASSSSHEPTDIASPLDEAASGVSGSIARAVALLHRAACVVAAIVARVCEHVNIAALRLIPAPVVAVSIPRAPVATRPAAGSPPLAPSAWPPQSVVQPAVAVSCADPELPSLFPRTDQIAQVAEAPALASWASYEPTRADQRGREALRWRSAGRHYRDEC